MNIPSKHTIKEILNRYINLTKSDDFELHFLTENGINTTVLADSIQYDMKFDQKYNVIR